MFKKANNNPMVNSQEEQKEALNNGDSLISGQNFMDVGSS